MIRAPAVLCLALACATPRSSSLDFEPPPTGAIADELRLEEPLRDVWERLVENVRRSSFTVDHIDEESLTLHVSFSSLHPERFVDCGTVRRVFDTRGERRVHEYNVAQGSSYWVARRWGPENDLSAVLEMHRSTELEGRASIYVAPRQQRTVVLVNAKYTLSISTRGVLARYDASGSRVGEEPLPVELAGVTFATDEAGTRPWGSPDEPIFCRALGTLEARILDLARP